MFSLRRFFDKNVCLYRHADKQTTDRQQNFGHKTLIFSFLFILKAGKKRMSFILENFNLRNIVTELSATSIAEIAIFAVIFYYSMKFIIDSRAWTLLKGIAVIAIFVLLSWIFQLQTVLWLLEHISTVMAVAIVIVFQPELRRTLETIGTKIGINFKLRDETAITSNTCKEIADAMFEMAKTRTGGLIAVQRNDDLKKYVTSGILLNSEISSELLINIFVKNTPLHDGAVIIKGKRAIVCV